MLAAPEGSKHSAGLHGDQHCSLAYAELSFSFLLGLIDISPIGCRTTSDHSCSTALLVTLTSQSLPATQVCTWTSQLDIG